MLTLINGDGNPRVTAAQDADWYGSLTGEKTCIMPANDKFSATVADANTIEISSGVLITKEGRRVQVDAETIEEIIIPTGTQGTDTYYIIGFHLHIDESGQQVAETFVETMENESDTITETTFREGSTSIYISLYRVKRNGLTLESVTRICPMYELSADEIVYGNTNVGAELTQINSDLLTERVYPYSPVTGVTVLTTNNIKVGKVLHVNMMLNLPNGQSSLMSANPDFSPRPISRCDLSLIPITASPTSSRTIYAGMSGSITVDNGTAAAGVYSVIGTVILDS